MGLILSEKEISVIKDTFHNRHLIDFTIMKKCMNQNIIKTCSPRRKWPIGFFDLIAADVLVALRRKNRVVISISADKCHVMTIQLNYHGMTQLNGAKHMI